MTQKYRVVAQETSNENHITKGVDYVAEDHGAFWLLDRADDGISHYALKYKFHPPMPIPPSTAIERLVTLKGPSNLRAHISGGVAYLDHGKTPVIKDITLEDVKTLISFLEVVQQELGRL